MKAVPLGVTLYVGQRAESPAVAGSARLPVGWSEAARRAIPPEQGSELL